MKNHYLIFKRMMSNYLIPMLMKTRFYFWCMLFGMGLFIACSDDDEGGNDDPGTNPGPETPTEEVLTLRFDKKLNGEELESLEYEANAAGQRGVRPWDLNRPMSVSMVGDSIHPDTVRLYLSVAGETPKEKKEIFFKIAPLKGQNDAERVADLEVLGTNYLEAGAKGDSITVVIHYPSEKARDYVGGLYIDTEKSKVNVIDEGAVFKFTLKYEWEKPETWTDEYWGEFSQDKRGFIATVLGSANNWNSPLAAPRYNPTMKKWIEKYGHPDSFTLPGLW